MRTLTRRRRIIMLFAIQVYRMSDRFQVFEIVADRRSINKQSRTCPIAEKEGEPQVFYEIKDRTINVHGKPGVSTQQTPAGFDRDVIKSKDWDLNIPRTKGDVRNSSQSSNGNPSKSWCETNSRNSKQSSTSSESKSRLRIGTRKGGLDLPRCFRGALVN